MLLQRIQSQDALSSRGPPESGSDGRDDCKPASVQDSLRVLKVVTNFDSGGTERQVHNLVSNIDRSRFAVQFACHQRSGIYLADYQKQGIPVSEFATGRLYSPLFLLRLLRFAWWMRRQRFDIVHAYNFHALVFSILAARLAGIPVTIASIRDCGVYLSKPKQILQKWVCRQAHLLLANARSVREWMLEQDYPAEKITVIENGIDTDRFAIPHEREGPIRKQWRIPVTAPLVVMVARLNRQKGVEDLLLAAAKINARHPDVHYLFVGKPSLSSMEKNTQGKSDAQRWQELIDEHGLGERIRMAGHCDQIPEVLAEADISVLPSHSEGLSNTLLESMAAGLPVVTTDVGGSPELIDHEVHGLLVPPSRPDELANALCRLIEVPQLASALGAAAAERARTHYSNALMVKKTQDLYLKAAISD